MAATPFPVNRLPEKPIPGRWALESNGRIEATSNCGRVSAPARGVCPKAAHISRVKATLLALTGKDQILGTLLYVSSEQINGQEADTRNDIFSFGLVLYEMLTGKRAFEGKSAASVIAAIRFAAVFG